MAQRLLTDIKKIVVHVTDSDDSLDIGIKEVNSWHKQNGWIDDNGVSCGYHYIVKRDGTIQRGRNDDQIGAHCYGHNRDSIGVVWVGRNQIDKRQYTALLTLITAIRRCYGLDIMDVYGHNEFTSKKTCPNLDMVRLRAELLFQKGENDAQ